MTVNRFRIGALVVAIPLVAALLILPTSAPRA